MTRAGEIRPLNATAALELGAGLALLFVPALAGRLLHVADSPETRVLMMLFGAAICGLGALAWLAASAESGTRRRAGWIFAGYHIAAALILVYGLGSNALAGVLASGAVLAHLVLAGVLARALTAGR
jgi:uncharacterized SAM-binding protein YcdF (DUF218 family)